MEGKINNVRNDLVDDISKQITNTITDIPEDIDNLRNVYLHIDVNTKCNWHYNLICNIAFVTELAHIAAAISPTLTTMS